MNKATIKSILAISTLAIALPFATLSHADHGDKDGGKHCNKHQAGQHHKGGMDKDGMGRSHMGNAGAAHHFKALNLTQDQQDKIFAIMHEQAPMMYETRKQERAAQESLNALAKADVYDDAKAQQLSEQLAQLEKNKTLSRVRTEAKVTAVLTPEQRVKAREMKDKRGAYKRDNVKFKQPNQSATKPVNG